MLKWLCPFLCLICLAADTKPREAARGWSRFRGPNGSGVSTDTGFPTVFGRDKNMSWRTPVRQGKSSPILTRQNIFLTAFLLLEPMHCDLRFVHWLRQGVIFVLI